MQFSARKSLFSVTSSTELRIKSSSETIRALTTPLWLPCQQSTESRGVHLGRRRNVPSNIMCHYANHCELQCLQQFVKTQSCRTEETQNTPWSNEQPRMVFLHALAALLERRLATSAKDAGLQNSRNAPVPYGWQDPRAQPCRPHQGCEFDLNSDRGTFPLHARHTPARFRKSPRGVVCGLFEATTRLFGSASSLHALSSLLASNMAVRWRSWICSTMSCAFVLEVCPG